MNPAVEPAFVQVEEYLAGEQRSDVRHEYIDGIVHSMAGGSDAHNLIAVNFIAALHSRLRGGLCLVFSADMKVRLCLGEKDVFYYPDVMVACDPRDTERFYRRFPKLIVEVLSESTEHIDRREKLLSYSQIETLDEYIVAAQDRMEVTVFRRANQWKPQIFTGIDQVVDLESVDLKMPIRDVYEGVKLGFS